MGCPSGSVGLPAATLDMQSAVILAPLVSSHSSGHNAISSDDLPNMAWQDRPENSLVLLILAQKADFELTELAVAGPRRLDLVTLVATEVRLEVKDCSAP